MLTTEAPVSAPAVVMAASDAALPVVSVVIPVYNEEASLPALFARLYPALDALYTSFEVIFVDDGSRDRSARQLAEQYERRPAETRVILFNGNFGQHRAILAAFAHCRGQRVVTLDADLQNPPEEIGRLLAAMDQGHDYVGTIRLARRDVAWRRAASRAMNRLRAVMTGIVMTDQGSMLRAFSADVVRLVNACGEMNAYVPALAYQFARSPVEIEVSHEARHGGESKYSLYSLIRLNFDLMTGFSVVPLQWFSMLGMGVSAGAGLLVLVLLGRRIVIGPEEGGLFTLFAIAFFLIGLALFGIGLLGEYVGRIFQEVRQRPRYVIKAVLQQRHDDDPRG